ncbi:hypothetical protein CROQUDRAFT_154013 [Cronartium quercuum f. sp. fusiforme G11]|uniref:Uncharacterized protein n=1 Tax=Cronartium quercuum f. sp. fusiforme G11 TaxID=708437 RepID=A0A9P6NP65_9BASI|nr:hypothetical protein CROQUDRAFT_154013 [Cronartium quercuum f. sp. fusiforme G11]
MFTFEARVDTTQNRHSVTQSAQTIGLLSLTGASIALVAVPLTLTGIAPFLGPATMAAEMASHSLVVAGASSEFLQVTTWIAAALANKTIHQIAIDRGVKEDQLEETLKNSNTIISSLKYFAISKSLVHPTKNIAASNRTEPSKQTSATKDHGRLSLLGGGILNQGSKWWSQRFDSESKEPSADHQTRTSTQVHGVYIGFKTDYDFEWRDRLDDLGQ